MPRLLVLNNYSLARVSEEVRRGDKPAHHLYGIERFPGMGYDVELVDADEAPGRAWPRSLVRALRALPPLGHLRQQSAALARSRNGDLIYAPCQTQTQTLSYLRAAHLFRLPIVALAHHPLSSRSRWPWNRPFLSLQLRGVDAFPSLSRPVAGEISRLSRRRDLSEFVPWGPDLSYYPTPDGKSGRGAVAAGRTGRDFLTFGTAATRAGGPATILCLRREALSELASFGSNVSVTAVEKESDLDYRRLMPFLASARVHAIPLAPGDSLAGLTSLTDALALGKPVIMTRHPLIDIDLEAEGIGRWIAPGDVAGWATALRWFDEHADEAVVMGMRARRLAEERYNTEIFAKHMVAIFDRVLARAAPPSAEPLR